MFLRGDVLTVSLANTVSALVLTISLAVSATTMPAAAQTAPIYTAAIPFDVADHEIKPSARSLLDGVAVRLLGNANLANITGYTDETEQTDQEDRRLALRRAVAVRSYLLEKGITDNRLRVFARAKPDQNNIGARINILAAP